MRTVGSLTGAFLLLFCGCGEGVSPADTAVDASLDSAMLGRDTHNPVLSPDAGPSRMDAGLDAGGRSSETIDAAARDAAPPWDAAPQEAGPPWDAAAQEAGPADGSSLSCSASAVNYNDNVEGTTLGAFDFQGAWSRSTGAGKYQDDDHYASVMGASATLKFRGVQVALYAARAAHHGMVAVSLDGKAATNVDLYAATRAEDQAVWSSGPMLDGEHTLRLVVTGLKSDASSGTTVAIDRVQVMEAGACSDAATPVQTDGGGVTDAGLPDATVPGPDAGGSAHATMYVEGAELFTRCAEPIVLRGVNHPTIYVDRAGAALPEIARTKANAVRLVWFATHGVAIEEADAAITQAIANGMVPILEMHDATGPGAWGQMSKIVSYWTSSAAVALIRKHQAWLIANIANEAGPDAGQDYAGFEATYREAITALRKAGIKIPLMIDASGWGRDVQVLLARGPALVEHDPEHNLILSGHLYDVLSRSQIASIYQQFRTLQLPFLVGEFANRSPVGTCGGAIDYRAIIGEAATSGIGWLAWSWGNDDPNTAWNTDCGEFDMARTFSFDSLEGWGREVAVTDTNSLQNTSTRPVSLTTGRCP
jgi:mannan endo-1,4-beta-mannosidase